jgi:hypothetical protein
MKLRMLGLFLLFFGPGYAAATDVSGRLMFGGFLSTERFNSDQGGSTSNDSEIFSERVFLKAININDKRWEATLDLRDKDDFFGKANQEQFQLNNANAFQVQELDTKLYTPEYMTTLGRFHYQEAGVAGVDGTLVQFRHTKDWNTGVFGGLNPKTEDQIYYQFNPKNFIFGAANTYQSQGGSWDKNLFLSNGVVTEMYQSEVDRTYFFNSTAYQWSRQNRLISLLYLDFVPRTYIQVGNFTWQEGYNDHYSSQLQLFGVDVIAYSRLQGVLETLPPSPYKEASAKIDYRPNFTRKYEVGVLYGERGADGLSKKEYYVAFEDNPFYSLHADFLIKGGYRNNFVSNDLFTHLYFGYYKGSYEYGVDVDFANQKYTNGMTLTPLIIELDYSYYFSRDLFGMISLQRAADQNVQILTGFFTVGYRFGDRDTPALRDGPPPKGQLGGFRQ